MANCGNAAQDALERCVAWDDLGELKQQLRRRGLNKSSWKRALMERNAGDDTERLNRSAVSADAPAYAGPRDVPIKSPVAASPSTNRTILLTGGTDGMGLHIARQLIAGQHCQRLLLCGRSGPKGAAVLEQLSREADLNDCHVTFHKADLGDLNQVRALASEVAITVGRLDVLINNAGVALKTLQRSPQGVELTHAVNLHAPYALTEWCLPLLEAARGTVVYVSSAACEAGLSVDSSSWPSSEQEYDLFKAYASSKHGLAIVGVLQAQRWSSSGVRVISVNPLSLMATPMVYGGFEPHQLPEQLSDPAEGARNVIEAAFMQGSWEATTGMFFDGDCRSSGRGDWCRIVPNYCEEDAMAIEQTLKSFAC